MSDWGSATRVAAQVVMAEGMKLEGELHLLTRPAYPPGPETPLEMLNRQGPFFVLILPTGEVAFVPKAQVSMVSCHRAEELDPERASAAKLVRLEVVMSGGEQYHGQATVELPPNRARALDYVNAPGNFLALWTDDTACYINKAQVRLIRPID